MEKNTIFKKVNDALDVFYIDDIYLIDNDLCERCLQHRIAVYLERQVFSTFYIDCEYNKSHVNQQTNTKVVSSIYGNYIDIIIGRRSGNFEDDLACFEIKKWNNPAGSDADRNKLSILTGGERFDYDYGFNLILGEDRESVVLEVYINGFLQIVSKNGYLILNEESR